MDLDLNQFQSSLSLWGRFVEEVFKVVEESFVQENRDLVKETYENVDE